MRNTERLYLCMFQANIDRNNINNKLIHKFCLSHLASCSQKYSMLILLFIGLITTFYRAQTKEHDKNPFEQHLPDCKQSLTRITKKTSAKAIVCPMFRDEEGFLSEWVAYYEMQGFDHVMLFNDGSIDDSLAEVKPWIDSGFVSVKTNWTVDSLRVSPAFTRNDFKKAMTMKALLDTQCKLQAISWGYKYFISLDIDEYVIPKKAGETVVDELEKFFNTTGRAVYCIEKYNYQQTPHTLEPVNLLTIEAYQNRMRAAHKMNYYMTVAPKCAYKLIDDHFRNISSEYIAYCCHFHGCQGYDFTANSRICTDNHKEEKWRLESGKAKTWYDALGINHYSRSLEKYALKQKTWKTASGEVKEGETAEAAAKGYDIAKFLARNLGWFHDDRAIRYSCQLRELLKQRTGEVPYLRPGKLWYRNAEFGRPVEDPDKRGRYGRPNPPGFKVAEKNPYHYHAGDVLTDPVITPPVKSVELAAVQPDVVKGGKGGKRAEHKMHGGRGHKGSKDEPKEVSAEAHGSILHNSISVP